MNMKLVKIRNTGENSYECELCKNTFSDNSNLAKHKENVKSNMNVIPVIRPLL